MKRMTYNKYQFVADTLLPEAHSLLDVGCRDAVLRQYLPPTIAYTGADLVPGPHVDQVCNIERGLPFSDSQFDTVVALDVLEHTDDIWSSFNELVRVTRLQLIILLPNIYYWVHRLRFLLGIEMGKYVLTPEPIEDRHRWLTSYRGAEQFARSMATKHGLTVRETIVAGGRSTRPVDAILSRLSKNAGAWAVIYVFERRDGTNNEDPR